jgi:radical SAM superfamily enzyme YgiQ (UPF0313 family)
MESKRGCPFACTFCAQHEIGKPKPYYYSATRIEQELELISRTNVQRVSVTDPVFNIGSTYHDFLRAVEQKKMQGVFNFQVRPELVFKQSDTALLDLLAVTQSEIELGLQTFDAAVNKRIKRGNHYEHIEKAIEMMREREVHFGLSLIYGLPGQTLDSFKRDIDKVRHMGIEHVIAFPLMLLPGTELYVLKNEEGVRERPLGEYGIPHVVAGPGFTESEWEEMHELAQDLNPDGRLF